MHRLRGFALCISCVLYASLQAVAQKPDIRNIPITWFEERDQHGARWHVDFDHPVLTYSQRLVVGVRTMLPTADNERRSDWHLIFRIADQKGNWFQNYSYHRMDLRSEPSKAQPLVWHGYAFVQPGTYRLAFLAYDAVGEQHFVWHKTLHIDRQNVLPDLDRT